MCTIVFAWATTLYSRSGRAHSTTETVNSEVFQDANGGEVQRRPMMMPAKQK
jgi:hypothetical protein